MWLTKKKEQKMLLYCTHCIFLLKTPIEYVKGPTYVLAGYQGGGGGGGRGLVWSPEAPTVLSWIPEAETTLCLEPKLKMMILVNWSPN